MRAVSTIIQATYFSSEGVNKSDGRVICAHYTVIVEEFFVAMSDVQNFFLEALAVIFVKA